ncbi:NimC/NimA family protein [Gordonibacter sp. 28C]|uniref:pyridoxamine 5'-phosphate oxidase family protein n=1 Tax=Gordonibacter sp. 28C TaxID=2078569 RepID=UPI000DF7FA84|nr:pyridoxamine 5'-phosphate oxidase family protein [Gordonibacter sp. 28C]RDB61324.1 NimC/NimA family protein [Gordonibacter sp. 28C]
MDEVLLYLKSCGMFYLATSEDGQPHVRPFGAVCGFEGKLYFVTSNEKDVYRQLKKNGKVEICAMHKGTWMRVCGEVEEDARREARIAMMNDNAVALGDVYSEDDGLMTVFRFRYGTATFYSFSEDPKVLQL